MVRDVIGFGKFPSHPMLNMTLKRLYDSFARIFSSRFRLLLHIFKSSIFAAKALFCSFPSNCSLPLSHSPSIRNSNSFHYEHFHCTRLKTYFFLLKYVQLLSHPSNCTREKNKCRRPSTQRFRFLQMSLSITVFI